MSELYLTPEGAPGPFPVAEVVHLERWSTRQSLPRIVFFEGPPPTLTDAWTRVSPLGGVDIEVRAPDLYRLAPFYVSSKPHGAPDDLSYGHDREKQDLEARLDGLSEGTTIDVTTEAGETFRLRRVPGGFYLLNDVVLATADIVWDSAPERIEIVPPV